MDCSDVRALALPLLLLLPACGDDGPAVGDEVGTSESGDGSDTTGADEVGTDGAESGDSDGGSETGTGETGEPVCDPANPVLAEQDYLAWGEGEEAVNLGACDEHLWWVAGAAGVELTVEVDASAPVELAINYPDTPGFVDALDTVTLFEPGEISFEAPRPGEFAVIVRPHNPGQDPLLELDYDISVACTNQCERETTRFPIVFVHGWTGFENIGPLTYFYNVREDLQGLGYPVATAVLDPYNSVEIRGEQLVDFVDASLTTHRARKVNLFGHSQGGIDSRYVAADAGGARGEQVGAVITLGTPHRGTPFTDIALGLIPGPTETVLIFLLEFLGAAQDQQSDVEASLYTLSETFMQGEFNSTYLDHPDVKYWSWTGETCPAGIGCMDAVDVLLLFSYETIEAVAGPNDGLVPLSSAMWGEFLGVIPADHIDQIGQIAGVTGINYDHIEFFRDNARMLKDNEY